MNRALIATEQPVRNPPGGTADLPNYAHQLHCFHRALEAELREVVRGLPIHPSFQVLDVACGDGFYLNLLAERLSAEGRLVGLDASREMLALAESSQAFSLATCPVHLLQGDVSDMPVEPAQFDFIWCAQSLYSLPEPVAALRQIARALAPGGLIAVLENDTLHQVLLPWPCELEIALRTAEYEALARETRRPAKFYIGRRLPAVFAAAGLEPLSFRTQCIDRSAPLGDMLERFLRSYLEQLAQRVEPYLPTDVAREFQQHLDSDSDKYLLRAPQFTMSWLNVLAIGRRPH